MDAIIRPEEPAQGVIELALVGMGSASGDRSEHPVLDHAVLSRLADRLGGRGSASRYLALVLVHGPGTLHQLGAAVDQADVVDLRIQMAVLQDRVRVLGLARLTATCMAAERELGPGGAFAHDPVGSGALRWWGRAVTDELAIGLARLSNDRSLL